MQLEIKTWLQDIERSISEIYEFIGNRKNFKNFQNDLKAKKAVERNIEIIGEALNRILKIQPEIPISNSRKIVDTRNRIIHGYDTITADVLWLIVTRNIPILEKEVKQLLK